ncbi:hypothetical protein BJ741DRAFT_579899 [Chytriomyces cf. hyalinus JEL632]|nr:hypothetical protein BJ741DRAFT_579899 [Chytriomyces cf. hyalinus JEL632]
MQQSSEGQLINVDGIDFKRLAQKPALSRSRKPAKALELALAASSVANNKDWWWKRQISKCCLRLGDWQEAKKQLENSLSDQEMLLSRLYLAKLYLDQPQKAPNKTRQSLKTALLFHIQINGTETCEIWNNIGLCAFYSQQYDSALPCFERALELSKTDTDTADVWYNIAHVGISVGDFELARLALKLALAFNAKHGEARGIIWGFWIFWRIETKLWLAVIFVEAAYRNAVAARKSRPSNARAVRLLDQISEMLL